MPRSKKRAGVYTFFITLPDRFYPFASRIHGKRVRGLASYEYTLKQMLKRYGPGHFGYKLALYRQVWHFVGAMLFIVFAAVASKILFGSEVALYVLLAAAVLAVSFQEFYLHPRRYGQILKKGIVDWSMWVMPIAVFVFLTLPR